MAIVCVCWSLHVYSIPGDWKQLFAYKYFPGPVRIMAPLPHEINSHIAEVLSASPNSSSVYVEGHG